mmetsp:Transcript_34135/g.81218  ORF Transcript_34135/g.81218 Transcript_34135/m.81218 type:complete len:282 (+) Transcript_34135:258-1103(+)
MCSPSEAREYISSMSVWHQRPRWTIMCLPRSEPNLSRRSVAPPLRHALLPKADASRPSAEAASVTTWNTTSVSTAVEPLGPTKKGVEPRAALGTRCSRSSHRRRIAKYGQVTSRAAASLAGCLDAMVVGTFLCLPYVSLTPRMSRMSAQCSAPVSGWRSVSMLPEAWLSHWRSAQHTPSAGRKGSPGRVPGSPPLISPWCKALRRAYRAVGQPGDRTSKSVESSASASRSALRSGKLSARSADGPSSYRICLSARASCMPPVGAMIKRPRCSSTIALMPET